MKLIIQIPCFNEEKTLPLVLRDVPSAIEGIDQIELQIVDDGSTDNTVEVARALGVHHVVSYVGNKGLGNAFKRGVENALENGADILVNTDGDNQYKSSDIPRLVEGIVKKQADIVIGNRNPDKVGHFSPIKKLLQKIGSGTAQRLAGINVPDAVSGFRAYSREALQAINITSDFSYVLDTTIQASKKRLQISHVDIEINKPTRPSRLFGSIFEHIKKSTSNMLKVYAMYEPLKVFSLLAFIFISLGLIPLARYGYFYFTSSSDGHIQSLILGAILLLIGFQFFGLGILGDLMSKQRRLIEDVMYRLKKQEEKSLNLAKSKSPDASSFNIDSSEVLKK